MIKDCGSFSENYFTTMHFSIPDTQEFVDNSGNSYLGYNIHINGLFHCTVRYKQLLHLHEHLTKETVHPLPPFPPKKLFPLTTTQQEERRQSLEKYIQTIGQNSTLNTSPLLTSFLLHAQQETSSKISIIESLDIFLQNNLRISLKVSTNESTTRVLKKLLRHLNLPEHLDQFFALFAVIEGERNANILRRLQDFESPVLTLGNINFPAVKLMVGRSYWETDNDVKLTENSVSLELLHQQAVAEVNRGWILVPSALQDHLRSLEDKREYLEAIRTCKYYGFTQFAPCTCDYPQPDTRVIVSIGRNELNLRMLLDDREHEAVFKVTRMRCWRVTTLHNGMDRSEGSDYSLELSFEYLVARNQLQWITIVSEQAILMSVSLQGMIDELLTKGDESREQEIPGKRWSYVLRDGHSKIVIGEGEDARKPREEVKRARTRGEHCDITENNAFHMIGDEDL
ncbi:sorting nexin-17 [Fopius arisanus]|uniref:Snx17_0 protein n=2 Tax=Fopius arisanus TaxID=64838 RepID=A0A0C9R6M5_9HYME|nr:PREDICTED: sorting nexin-17 [Fopius arisanus]